jgi:hypothetical protein
MKKDSLHGLKKEARKRGKPKLKFLTIRRYYEKI